MNRPTLSIPTFKIPPKSARWIIDRSHMIEVPDYIDALDLTELRSAVRVIAKGKKFGRPYGKLHFRYELDANEAVSFVHVTFTNRHGVQTRFMKLRRSDVPLSG